MCIPQKTERESLLSESRFPSELKKDLLYLGNMINVLQHDYIHLRLLGIEHVFYFSAQPFRDLDKAGFSTTWI